MSSEKEFDKGYTIKEILQQREEIKLNKHQLRHIQGRADEKNKERITHRNKFVIIEEEDIPTFFALSGPTALLLHLISKVNRLDKKGTFGNLDKYYKMGYLATVRTQNYIAKEMGESQQNISNWLKKLERLGFIKKIGTETIKIGSSFQVAVVWALGEKVKTKYGEIEEVFYYETLRKRGD